ncbi:hypothetical protein [Geoalkalibacter sp.]|uniref:hypothetical protein n=1 Tax=Geoalkalibacter sp. TaxID=3041440 RepID=UPI00272DD606|nr:hypothetical protein [Geoalkalibacter sp.]
MKNLVIWAAFFMAMLPIHTPLYGAEANLLGPESLAVGKGKPLVATRSFSGIAGETAMLIITNGTSGGDHRVSTGSISVNGIEILTPSDFNQQVGTLTRVFALKGQNELIVTLGGGPGSLITLAVAGGASPPTPSLPTARLGADPSTILSGESSSLSWTTTNAQRVTIQPGIGEVPSSGSIQVSPTQTTLYRLTAEGSGGQAAAEVRVSVLPPPVPPGITFDPYQGAPLDGATVDQCEITVSGSVTVANPSEIGVRVAGVVAQVDNGRFIANHVSLTEGSNTLTAIATDADGNTWSTSAGVFCAPTDEYINLKADTEAGLAPLPVVFSVDTNLTTVSGGSFQCSGPVEKTPVAGEDNTYAVHLEMPGLYTCKLRVLDLRGTAYEKSLGIRVYSKAELDGQLKSKWQAMTEAMWTGDVDAAVAHFSTRTREVYAIEMAEMGTVLDQIVADMQGIELVGLRGDRAVYELQILRDGVPYSFQLEFQLDEDGLWRIRAF